jgi:chemotaxis signal transduction protein
LSSKDIDFSKQLAEIRDTFDKVFMNPPNPPPEEFESFLIIQIKKVCLAIKVNEISGLEVNRKIVPLPSDDSGLLGIAGIHGCLVPVYCLATLLGYTQDRNNEPRWLAVLGKETSVREGEKNEVLAIAFAEFDSYVQMARSEVGVPEVFDGTTKHVKEILHLKNSGVCSVLSVPSIINEIKNRAGRVAPMQRKNK